MLRTARVPLFGLVGLILIACGPSPGSEVTAGSSETAGPETTTASSAVPTSGASLTEASGGTSGDGTAATNSTTAVTAATTGDSTNGETPASTSTSTSASATDPGTTGGSDTTGDTNETNDTGETDGTDDSDDSGDTEAACAVIDSLVIDDNTDLAALGCIEEVIGDMQIGPTTQLASLAPLKNLRKVGGALTIQDNEALIDLVGLDSLEHVGGWLSVVGNPALVTMDGLGSLTRLGGLHVEANHSLIALSPMGGVVELGPGVMWFVGLPKLQSFKDLAGLTVMPATALGIRVELNLALTDLKGLGDCCAAVDVVDLELKGNHALPSLAGLEPFDHLGRLVIVANHALPDLSGLDNLTEVDILEIGQECFDLMNEPSPVGNNALVSLEGLGAVNAVHDVLSIMGNKALPVALANAFHDGLDNMPKSEICKNLGGFNCPNNGPCPQ